MTDKKICDNCGKEIEWKKHGWLTGRIYYNKEGFWNAENWDYDFCSKECLKSILLKEKILGC